MMQNYKRDIMLALLIIVLNIVVCYMAFGISDKNSSVYVLLLRQYPYTFIFSALLFMVFYSKGEVFLELNRYGSREKYVHTKMSNNAKSFGLILSIVTIGQWFLFYNLDPMFNFMTLIYRNLIFYILINIVSYIINYIPLCNKYCVYLLYAIWVILMRIATSNPELSINSWNIFILLIRMDWAAIVRFLLIAVAVYFFLQIRALNHERYMKKWLE